MRNIRFTVFGITAAFLSVGTVQGTPIGTDNASVSAYNSGWSNGSDGFSSGDAAFGAWSLVTEGDGSAGFFIGNSPNLDGGSGADINVSGESFGLFGARNTSFTQAKATRQLGSPLAVGQTLSLDLAVNFRNGNKGLDVLDGGSTIFNFNVGGDDYVVNNATTGGGSIGNAYSANTSFSVEITQSSVGGGYWSITRSGGVTDLDTGTFTGAVSGLALYVNETDGGSPNDLYANSLAIVPEPGSMALLIVGAGLSVLLRRFR